MHYESLEMIGAGVMDEWSDGVLTKIMFHPDIAHCFPGGLEVSYT